MDIDKAINHLQKVDSRMKTLINKYGHPKFSPIDNYFEALIKSIVSHHDLVIIINSNNSSSNIDHIKPREVYNAYLSLNSK